MASTSSAKQSQLQDESFQWTTPSSHGEGNSSYYYQEEEEDELAPQSIDASRVSIRVLPTELILHLFSFVGAIDLCRCTSVCRLWRKISEDNVLWKPLCDDNNYNNLYWIPKNERAVAVAKPTFMWKDIYKFFHCCEFKIFADKLGKNGCGKFTSANGIYKGELVNDRKHGRGVHCWIDHSKYEGEWKDDRRHGYGFYQAEDGIRYEGLHSNDKRSRGLFYWTEGSVYEGEYAESCREGHGRFTWPDGDFYEGGWKRGGRFGTGKLWCIQPGEEGVYLQENWNEEVFEFYDKGPKTHKLPESDDTRSSAKRKAVEMNEETISDDNTPITKRQKEDAEQTTVSSLINNNNNNNNNNVNNSQRPYERTITNNDSESKNGTDESSDAEPKSKWSKQQ